MKDIPEKDWRYLSSLKKELLEKLSLRINTELADVLSATDLTEDEKRHKIYDMVNDRDKTVGYCFNDWSRSRFIERCLWLIREGLLTEKHILEFTSETRERIEGLKETTE